MYIFAPCPWIAGGTDSNIAAPLKLSFEKYNPEHEDPWKQNMWIVDPFVEHKETAFSHEETLQLIELSSDKELESTFNSMSDSKF